MRKIILDTETTGLDFHKDRIIEIACVELVNDIPTGEVYHKFFSPGDIEISQEAQEIHGLSNEYLKDFELFDQNVLECIEFIGQSPIIIHNAQFDLTMINNSLKRNNFALIDEEKVICTLVLARKKFPGSKVNLNALCRRFDISLEQRLKHDAKTDCFLLAQVYLELIGGKQHKFLFNEKLLQTSQNEKTVKKRKKTPIIKLTSAQIEQHNDLLKKLKNSIWKKFKD